MIIKNNTDERVERRKRRIGLTGDVYIFNSHFIESLESHKRLIPNSTAGTIEEAYEERVAYEEKLAEERAARAALEAETENGEETAEESSENDS